MDMDVPPDIRINHDGIKLASRIGSGTYGMLILESYILGSLLRVIRGSVESNMEEGSGCC